ncbi:hypothetical protein U9M48_007195 [Paspalum notatum var. saurae]|uniref:DUF7787 domain-containing protein n=1 Tax=Paspalum notatum var. saurae TaxID=547442 RepID=A0AAQ3SK38_PASNO
MTRIPAAERPRLTLEDYILFFTTRSGHGLSLHQLNDIIYMHAFARIHRTPKPAMVDALRSVELMRPRRSSVPLNATAPPPSAAPAAAAALSLEEVTRDIEDLGWRECPVGSLLSVRAGMRSPAAAEESPVPISAIAPGSSAERMISPPRPALAASSSSSPLPPALPAAARRKRSSMGKGKAAMRTRRRRVVELLTIPSLDTLYSPVVCRPEQDSGEVALTSA